MATASVPSCRWVHRPITSPMMAPPKRELDNQGNAERGVVIAGHPNAVLLFGSTWAEERFQCTCPLV